MAVRGPDGKTKFEVGGGWSTLTLTERGGVRWERFLFCCVLVLADDDDNGDDFVSIFHVNHGTVFTQ